MNEDPSGYNISHTDDGELLVVRVADQAELGTYSSRDEAVAAARADAGIVDEEPERTGEPVD